MKTIKFLSVFAVALLVTGRLWAQEQLTVPLSDPGKPFKLNVGLIDGSITVIGYEGKRIVVEGQVDEKRKDRDKEKEKVAGMHRLNSNGMDISAQENNNQVTVHSSMGKQVNLIIKVPKTTSTFKISTVNGGDITGSNLDGELEVSNVNGSIKLTDISGSVVATTVNGPVIVTFKSIDPKAAMAFSTLNGKIDVTFPASLKANVKLKSDRGDIFTDFDVATEQQKPNVTRTNKDGMYGLKVDEWVYGKIAGGGPELMMKTTFGAVYIRKAK
ncbi:DUF4097 family beta strand repeat-containing protein [Mucilaginibacter sp. OK283]|jgi:hypothetical protein|uniref:DUF4097 family beta strand repeat-containing protein n=1 Tax=Mucilaginibacter sp. OK283 TaxID=1881049 RepID=UPI0008B74F54|nr:DUF4097 family beta strand repeat-containing protein [Mucilaginibacter sp. OK283]SEO63556.1 hypothetical protein SAMN05428947_103208 [Mucilaginibacter sp. OK283]